MPLGSTTTTTFTGTTTSTTLQGAILGKALVIKDPNPTDPSKRKIVVVANEVGSGDPLDPAQLAANGATVTVSAEGATASSQTFSMPAPWTLVGTTGAKYLDKAGTNGPVKLAILTKSEAGKFKLKLQILGSLGPGPQPHVLVVPPNPGTGASVQLQVAGGAEYCVGYGGAAGGKVVNKGTTTFKVTNPTAPVCSP